MFCNNSTAIRQNFGDVFWILQKSREIIDFRHSSGLALPPALTRHHSRHGLREYDGKSAESASRSVDSRRALDGIEQLRWVVALAIFEDQLHLADVGDARGGVAVDHYQVGLLAGGHGAEMVQLAEIFRPVGCRDLNGFERRESALHQQLDIALVGETGEGAAVAGRVGAGHEESARFDKGILESQLLLESLRHH